MKDGLDYRCRECRAKSTAEWRTKNPDRAKAASAKYQQSHKAQRAAYNKHYYASNTDYHHARYVADRDGMNARAIEWQRANPEKVRNHKMRTRYGISVADYDAMLSAQGAVCLICDRGPKTNARLVIDHDHSTGAIRGLLCDSCNKGLGNFGDNADRLRRAIVYLSR